jgi:hypothetical protein
MGYKRAAFTTGLTLGSVVLAAVALGIGATAGNVDTVSSSSPSAAEPIVAITPAPTPGASLPPATPPAELAAEPAAAAAASAPVVAPAIDPLSAAYNPYTDPNSPTFVSDSDKQTWLALQSVIRQCMADRGLEYLNWEWWAGGDPQPKNLSYDAGIAWIVGMYGDSYMNPTGNWEDGGCSGYALHVTGDTTH